MAATSVAPNNRCIEGNVDKQVGWLKLHMTKTVEDLFVPIFLSSPVLTMCNRCISELLFFCAMQNVEIKFYLSEIEGNTYNKTTKV